ncbi:hypothetical protein DNTS_004660 [Danionella cerebrum]|uniref:Uncharacterized protein n=1 Tax=Danionella cerebrum TaxID=2873325 RepID=A0A553QYZ0_9TELE|nr:hypothetical protein DNTS_004660 [Danionella translucida]
MFCRECCADRCCSDTRPLSPSRENRCTSAVKLRIRNSFSPSFSSPLYFWIKEICAVDKWPSQGSDKFSEANTPFVVWPNLERGTAGHSRGTFGGFGGSEPLDSSRVRLHGVNLSPGKDVVQLLFSGVICYSRKHQTEHYVNTAVTMLLFSKIPQRFSK